MPDLAKLEEKRPLTLQDSDTTPSASLGRTAGTATAGAAGSNLFYVGFACGVAVLLGYDIGVMSGAITGIEASLSLGLMQKQLIMGSLNFVSGFGALLAGGLSDRYGRRACIAASMALYCAGSGSMLLGGSFAAMLAGRVVVGMGVGVGMCVVPLYVAELVPARTRGRLTACFELAICGGIVLGYVANVALFNRGPGGGGANWRTMLALPLPLALASGVCATCVLPRSPRWLLMRGEIEEARKVLLLTHRETEAAEALRSVRNLLRLDGVQGLSGDDSSGDDDCGRHSGDGAGSSSNGAGAASENSSVCGVLCGAAACARCCPTSCGTSPAVDSPSNVGARRALLVGIALAVLQQANGSEAAVYYVPVILKDAGIKDAYQQQLGALLVGLFKSCFVGIGLALVDHERAGRRPVLLFSCATVTVALLALATSFATAAPPTAIGASLCAFMGAFAVGEGPVTWVVISEVFPLRLRGRGVALAMCLNRLVSGLCATTFLSLSGTIGSAGAFYFFSVISFIHVIFVYYCVPETKGQSLEQIEVNFHGQDHDPCAAPAVGHCTAADSFQGGGEELHDGEDKEHNAKADAFRIVRMAAGTAGQIQAL